MKITITDCGRFIRVSIASFVSFVCRCDDSQFLLFLLLCFVSLVQSVARAKFFAIYFIGFDRLFLYFLPVISVETLFESCSAFDSPNHSFICST